MENIFITITGHQSFLGLKPYKVGRVVKLVKDRENEHDEDAIRVELPFIDTIGYVANSTNTVYKGTHSAGRLYDKIGEEAFAQIMFVTHSSAIALILPPDGENAEDGDHFEIEAEPHNIKSGTKNNSEEKKNKIGFC
jgi:hypothetical protein